MKAIKIIKNQGYIRVFGVGGIKLYRESWINPVEELKMIIKKPPFTNGKKNSN
jgi:hypothetical protein